MGFVCKPDLPPHLNVLFKANKPLPVLNKEPKGKSRRYGGIFESEEQIKNILYGDIKFDLEKNKNNKYLKIAIENKKNQEELKSKIKQWNPKNDPKISGIAENTIFVARLNYIVDEKILERNFRPYGKIIKINLIRDKNGKSRGYAFIEYSDRRSAKEAYDSMHRKTIEGKEILVDFEKEREKKGFLPLKLGGKHGKYREYPSIIRKELEYIHEVRPELKPENLSEFRADLVRKQEKEKDREKNDEKHFYPKSSKVEKKRNLEDLQLNESHEHFEQTNPHNTYHNHHNSYNYNTSVKDNNNVSFNEEDVKTLSKKRANDSKHFKNFKEYLHKASDTVPTENDHSKIKTEADLEAGEINFK